MVPRPTPQALGWAWVAGVQLSLEMLTWSALLGGSQVGYQTWYPNADPSYIQRCQIKDEQTTQATFGFKICGMQVCLPQKINRYEQP